MEPSGNPLRHDYIVAGGVVYSFQMGSDGPAPPLNSAGRIDSNETVNEKCVTISEDPEFDRAVHQAAQARGAPRYNVTAYPGTIQHTLGFRNCQTWADDVLNMAQEIVDQNEGKK